MSYKTLSKHVVEFISEYGNDDMLKQWNDNETKFKKLFKQKDTKKAKGGPKKSKSSYMFFCDDERQKLKTENLDLSNKEIISTLAARWKTFKEDPKNVSRLEHYTKLAEQDKQRYETERENYVPEVSSEEGVKKKRKKSNSDVKKNKSSYMFFCAEERSKIIESMPELNNKQIITELGSRWKTLKESNPGEVARYESLAKDDKERYTREKGSSSEKVEEAPKEELPKTKKKVVKVDESSEEEAPKEVKPPKKEKKPKEDKPKKEEPKDEKVKEDKSKKEKKPKDEKVKEDKSKKEKKPKA
jgi:hypothetical protein